MLGNLPIRICAALAGQGRYKRMGRNGGDPFRPRGQSRQDYGYADGTQGDAKVGDAAVFRGNPVRGTRVWRRRGDGNTTTQTQRLRNARSTPLDANFRYADATLSLGNALRGHALRAPVTQPGELHGGTLSSRIRRRAHNDRYADRFCSFFVLSRFWGSVKSRRNIHVVPTARTASEIGKRGRRASVA